MQITNIKKVLNANSSEELFGIPQKPSEQCPKIDDLIDKLKGLYVKIHNYSREIQKDEEIESIHSTANDIEWESSDIESDKELNEIRASIIDIREWGQEWKNLAKRALEILTEEQRFYLLDIDDSQIETLKKYNSIKTEIAS